MIQFGTLATKFSQSVRELVDLGSKLRDRSNELITTLSRKIKNDIRLNEEACKNESIHVNDLKSDLINYNSSHARVYNDVIVESSSEKWSAFDLYRLYKSKTLRSTFTSNNYNFSTNDEYQIREFLITYESFVSHDHVEWINNAVEEVGRLSQILCNGKSSKREEEGEESSYEPEDYEPEDYEPEEYEPEEYNIDTIGNMKYPKSIGDNLNFKFNYDGAVFDVSHNNNEGYDGVTTLSFNECVVVTVTRMKRDDGTYKVVVYLGDLLYNTKKPNECPGYKSKGYGSWLLDMITNISRKLGSEVLTLHDASQKKIHSTIWKLPLLSTIKKGCGFYMSKGFLIYSDEDYNINLKKTNDYIKDVNMILDDPNGISKLKVIIKSQNKELRSIIKKTRQRSLNNNNNIENETTFERDLLKKNNGWIAYFELRNPDHTIRDILNDLVKDVESQDEYNEQDKLKLERSFARDKSATFEKGDPKWRKILLGFYNILTNNTCFDTHRMLPPTPGYLIKYLTSSIHYDENKREMVSDEDVTPFFYENEMTDSDSDFGSDFEEAKERGMILL